MTNLIRFDGFDDAEIRVTADGRYSVYDVIRFCGCKGERKVWERLAERYSEVVTFCHNFKFAGKGQKAQIAQVQIGIFAIEGLMDETGTFYVAVPQIADRFSFDKNQASRDFKALLGAGFQFDKVKSVLHPKAVNAVTLPVFEKIMFELALKGNQGAIEMSRALIGLSLHQLFSDAFGQKFEAEDRQRWLQTRFNTKHDFRPLTDQLQRYGFKEPWEYAKYISTMQAKIGLPNGTRDMADFDTLNKLERIQTKLTAYMECGVEPYQAINKLP